MHLFQFYKTYGQFQNRYPNGLSDEIIGNTDTRISMGVTDVLTANYFVNLIGVASVETTSIRKENSIEGDIGDFGQKNISTIKRNLLNSDEILRLPTNKTLIAIRGNKPLLLEKVIYKEHPNSNQLHDSLISDYIPNWTKNKSQEKQKPKVEKKVKENNEPKKIWGKF